MQGIIQEISTKKVTTRYGEKSTYSINVDNTWYSCAFKQPPNKGSEVSFDVKSTKWGEEVDGSLKVLKAAAGGAAISAADAPKSGATQRPKGNFPIPATDGQRSIIRQNSLTQANSYIASQGRLEGAEAITPEALIEIAKKFEAYSAGDADALAARKIAAKKRKEAEAAAAKVAAEAEAEREEDLDDDDLLPGDDD